MRVRIAAAVHDPPVWTLPPSEVRRIGAALPDCDVIDVRTPEERRREFPLADVILTTRLTQDEALLAGRVRWIHSTAVGVSPILVPDVIARDIVATNARGLHADFIAEHAIALALAVRRSLHTATARQRDRAWAQQEIQAVPCPPARRSPMLVVGLGEIGARVARMAAGLGFTVVGVRKRLDRPAPPGVSKVVDAADFVEELRLADVVVLAAPRTTETKAMIGAEEFAVMRPTAVLVNVARGRLVDEDALVEALRTNRIGGAGLDAFVREPLPSDNPLWDLPNVLISPHTAAFGEDYWTPAVNHFLENFGRFVRGEPLMNVVDKVHGY